MCCSWRSPFGWWRFRASFWALDRSGQAGTGDEGLFDELGDYDDEDDSDDEETDR